MGLGKTIEIIALILGNPMQTLPPPTEIGDLDVIKATLIVVPPTLLGQWFDEFKNRVQDIDTVNNPFSVIRADDLTLRGNFVTSLSRIRRPSYISDDGVVHEASPWGLEYDGVSKLEVRKGEEFDYKLNHALGQVTFTVIAKKHFSSIQTPNVMISKLQST